MRPIENYAGQSMTKIDYLLKEAIKFTDRNGLPISSIIPKRENGRITGYYVLNEERETALKTYTL